MLSPTAQDSDQSEESTLGPSGNAGDRAAHLGEGRQGAPLSHEAAPAPTHSTQNTGPSSSLHYRKNKGTAFIKLLARPLCDPSEGAPSGTTQHVWENLGVVPGLWPDHALAARVPRGTWIPRGLV